MSIGRVRYILNSSTSKVASNTGTPLNTNDSNQGTTSPYGCYSYKNNNGTSVSGSNPQGLLLTQPI